MHVHWKKWLLIPVIATVLAGFGCGASPAETTAVMTLTDQLGRTVSLAKIPQRIISMAPSNTEILYALGLGDKIVARTDYDDYPAEVTSKPSIGGFSTPDFEKIISLSPDLIVAANLQWMDVITQLEEKGVPVLVIDPKTIDQLLDGITLVGKATGVDAKAAEVVSGLRQRVDAVSAKTASLPVTDRPRVLYIVWHDPLMVAGQGTLHDELIRVAGGTNVASGLSAFAQTNAEFIIDANPQVVIVGVGMYAEGDAAFKWAINSPDLASTDARHGEPVRVYSVDSNLSDRPGPRAIDALEEFARLIHPELFQ
jgi:iron complex transport system substrate-binding protein